MRVLFVSPMPSHPQTQGNSARLFALANCMKVQGCEIDFMYYGLDGLSRDQEVEHVAFWRRFFFVPAQPLSRMTYPDAWGVDDWCPDELCIAVARLVSSTRYDAVIVNYVWMSRVFNFFNGPLKVLDTHDLFGNRHLEHTLAGLEPRWFFTTESDENIGFDRADIVIAIQSKESGKIARRTKAEVMTIGHIMSPCFHMINPSQTPSIAAFGYIGSKNPWNVRSIKTFDRCVAGFSIGSWALAGSISLLDMNLESWPMRLGMIKGLETFYGSVDFIVNPMIGGTGLKIKTVEALAYGRAICGTVSAFEGIPSESEFHSVDTMEELVDAVGEISRSPQLRIELEAASCSVFARYQADVQSGLSGLLRSITGSREALGKSKIQA